MVQKLCRDDNRKNVTLSTNMWRLARSTVSEQGRASQREEELQTKEAICESDGEWQDELQTRTAEMKPN